jgi:bidirectional [NiFe] hydrogenase diaphorase subunit
MKMVTLEIDGKKVEAEEGSSLLEACRAAGADIPTLCHNKDLVQYGACRMCMVEITKRGWAQLVASCCYPVEEGLAVRTSTEKIEKIRKTLVELMMTHASSGTIKKLAERYGLTKSRFQGEEWDCVLCGNCVRYCAEIKGDHAVYFKGRGAERKLALLPGQYMACAACRQCWELCPAGWIASGAAASE